MIKLNDIYSVKTLDEILAKIKTSLESKVKLVKSDDTEDLLQEEFKKNTPLNLSKIYKNFLTKKRER